MRFELNIVDEWGCAYYYGDDRTGVVYNMYRDDIGDYSAIYWFEFEFDDYLSIHYDKYVHYKIDFTDDEWEHKLQNKMDEVYNYFRKTLDK